MFPIPRIVAFASPREEEVVIANPLSLLVEFSNCSIRGGFPREEIGRSLHREETDRCRIFQEQPLRGAPEREGAIPSTQKRKRAVHQQETVLRESWVRGHILPPLDSLEPIFVNGAQPGIGVMADNPCVKEVNKVRIPFADRKGLFCLEQRFR